ncbi:endonuclease III [Miniphocaeibacter halophilus]|uniref:Endonuclease III n=1 Tax=Miniphocaeibacter halophilus TaxID=2931922 RepID=A0AC61MQ27_9FIRM|nr:endonuclease III [Miniphocaeibacter halophilus]QQK07659.1 endonuclease III [Miniphocaeibacter halophilus]
MSKHLKIVEIEEVLNILEKDYPDAKAELNFSTPYELLIATILSAQCTDVQVNKTTAVLFKKYNTPEKMVTLSTDELGKLIKSCGFYKTKSANILSTSRILIENYNSKVPNTMEKLTELPGVGRKTANVVLSNAFNIPSIAVDTHVFRVSNRIGIANADNVEKTEKQLRRRIKKDRWSKSHHILIFHGRRVCKARNPSCEICNVRDYCLYYNKK